MLMSALVVLALLGASVLPGSVLPEVQKIDLYYRDAAPRRLRAPARSTGSARTGWGARMHIGRYAL
jgi:hypothetical protein